MRTLVLALAAVAVAYVVLLILGGWFAEGCVVDRAGARIARSLAAEVSIGDADVSLLSGEIALRDIAIERTSGGHVALSAKAIDADVAGMGMLLFDREIDHLSVRGVSISISAAGAATLPRDPDRPPITARRMTLREVRLEAVLTEYVPGLGRVVLDIERAETGRVNVRDVVTWLFDLRELVARVELPGGVTADVRYADNELMLGAGVLGAEPVTLPFALPVPEDGKLELAQLGDLASRLAVAIGKAMLARRARGAVRGWLEDKLRGGAEPSPDAGAP